MYVLVDERVVCFVPPSFSRIPVLIEITDVAEEKIEIRGIGVGENYCKIQDKEEKGRKEYAQTMKLRNDTETILNLF